MLPKKKKKWYYFYSCGACVDHSRCEPMIHYYDTMIPDIKGDSKKDLNCPKVTNFIKSWRE